MQYQEAKHLDGLLVVVETDDGTAWLGVAEVSRDSITIRTGLMGRPPVIPLADVDEISVALFRDDVVPA